MAEVEANLREALHALRGLCDAWGITLMLRKGTLLGAYRNGRLLPWDDDIDAALIICENAGRTLSQTNLYEFMDSAMKAGFRHGGWGQHWIHSRTPTTDGILWADYIREHIPDGTAGIPRITMAWPPSSPAPEYKDYYAHYGGVPIDLAVIAEALPRTAEHWGFSRDVFNPREVEKYALKMYGNIWAIPPNVEQCLYNEYGATWHEVCCNVDMWARHHNEMRTGAIPDEVEEFTDKHKMVE